MTCDTIIVGIVVPLISAFIGGLITFLGVWLTIRSDRKSSEYNKRLSAKPWLYSMSDKENFDCTESNDIIMQTSRDMERKYSGITFLIKNTDNGVCIIDRFETENNNYYPILGKILDKSSITYLHIFFDKNETLKDMFLYVKDIYGNEYKYKAYQQKDAQGPYLEEVSV